MKKLIQIFLLLFPFVMKASPAIHLTTDLAYDIKGEITEMRSYCPVYEFQFDEFTIIIESDVEHPAMLNLLQNYDIPTTLVLNEGNRITVKSRKPERDLTSLYLYGTMNGIDKDNPILVSSGNDNFYQADILYKSDGFAWFHPMHDMIIDEVCFKIPYKNSESKEVPMLKISSFIINRGKPKISIEDVKYTSVNGVTYEAAIKLSLSNCKSITTEVEEEYSSLIKRVHHDVDELESATIRVKFNAMFDAWIDLWGANEIMGTEHLTIEIPANTATINDVIDETSQTVDVYTTSGVLVKKQIDRLTVKDQLPKGIYIIVSSKGIEKIVVR